MLFLPNNFLGVVLGSFLSLGVFGLILVIYVHSVQGFQLSLWFSPKALEIAL